MNDDLATSSNRERIRKRALKATAPFAIASFVAATVIWAALYVVVSALGWLAVDNAPNAGVFALLGAWALVVYVVWWWIVRHDFDLRFQRIESDAKLIAARLTDIGTPDPQTSDPAQHPPG